MIDVSSRRSRGEPWRGSTAGYGPDLVIECTGQVAGWQDAFARVRRGGRVVFFGGCPPDTALSVDTRRMHYDNLTLLAPFHFRPRDVRGLRDSCARQPRRRTAIINARRSLSELAEVFAHARTRRGAEMRGNSLAERNCERRANSYLGGHLNKDNW